MSQHKQSQRLEKNNWVEKGKKSDNRKRRKKEGGEMRKQTDEHLYFRLDMMGVIQGWRKVNLLK